jgi:hypothetical protein
VAGLALEAAHIAGAEVETDARSSDFLKIKVGDTRYDILGGLQQNLVFGWRQLTGEKKSSTSGAVTTFATDIGDRIAGRKKEDVITPGPYTGNRLTAAADLVGNKAAPIPAAALKILAGKDKAGNDVNPLTEIGQLFVPIGLQSAFNARSDPKTVLKGLPEFGGIGSQTYGTKDINITDTQKKTVSKITDKNKQEAYTRFYQTSKTASGIRNNVSEQINDALAAKDLTKAKKLAADYNKKYSDGFNDWRSKYKSYADATLLKEFNSGKINLTPASIKQRLTAIKEKS